MKHSKCENCYYQINCQSTNCNDCGNHFMDFADKGLRCRCNYAIGDCEYYVDQHSAIVFSVDECGFFPTKAHDSDAGIDLRTPISFTVKAHGSYVVDTLNRVKINDGYVGFLKSKSGLMTNHGIVTDGTIDAGYNGTIKAMLFNLSDEDYKFERGDKIVQLVIQPFFKGKIVTGRMTESERGENGFGSSGK